MPQVLWDESLALLDRGKSRGRSRKFGWDSEEYGTDEVRVPVYVVTVTRCFLCTPRPRFRRQVFSTRRLGPNGTVTVHEHWTPLFYRTYNQDTPTVPDVVDDHPHSPLSLPLRTSTKTTSNTDSRCHSTESRDSRTGSGR